jgi:transposase
MTITTVGIDLAKNVFAVHCIDQNGKAVLVKPKVSRAALSELIAGLPPCVIGMEAARVPTIGQDYSGSMAMMSG